MDTNINDINSQNVINGEEKKINKRIGIIPLVLVLGLLLSLLMVSILVKERKKLNFRIDALKNQIEQLRKEMDKNLNIVDIQPELKEVETIPMTSPDIYSCGYWEDKVFDKTEFSEPAGTLTVIGSIVKREKDKPFSENEKITNVYLVVSEQKENPQKLFYEYYRGLVERKNSINDMEGQKLLFRIGMLENSKFIPGLALSDNLKNKIMPLIDKNEIIKLKLTIDIPPGRSGFDGESYACSALE